MGMYCACGVKKSGNWVCECDWKGWYLCYPRKHYETNIPKNIPIKEIPDQDGVYEVRTFADGDDFEETSRFSTVKKNWGQYTNQAISHWEIVYDDGWMGYKSVYAWKAKE